MLTLLHRHTATCAACFLSHMIFTTGRHTHRKWRLPWKQAMLLCFPEINRYPCHFSQYCLNGQSILAVHVCHSGALQPWFFRIVNILRSLCGPVGCLINRSTCSHTTIFLLPPGFCGSMVLQFVLICKNGTNIVRKRLCLSFIQWCCRRQREVIW